jgi:hypothetical protein
MIAIITCVMRLLRIWGKKENTKTSFRFQALGYKILKKAKKTKVAPTRGMVDSVIMIGLNMHELLSLKFLCYGSCERY